MLKKGIICSQKHSLDFTTSLEGEPARFTCSLCGISNYKISDGVWYCKLDKYKVCTYCRDPGEEQGEGVGEEELKPVKKQ